MTPSNVSIRHLASCDRATWLAMRESLWPDESSDELAEDCDRFLDGDEKLIQAVLIAESDGRDVGMIELSTRNYAEGCLSSPVAYIEAWYVEQDARQSGIGSVLVAAAEEWARSLGLAEIASDTQLDNTVSQIAHRALGFEEQERIVCFRKPIKTGDSE